MSNFTVVLWDVDDTLLDFSYSQRYALEKCFRDVAGREMTEAHLRRYAEINDAYWKRLELGEVTKDQLQTGRFVALFREFGLEGIDVEAFCREYQAALGSVFSFLDDSLNVCRGLRGRVKQYVITNGVSSTQRGKLVLSGLADVMDGIFVSEEIGVPKPDIRFFEYCLNRIAETDKSKILVVGDSLTSDIKGGVQAGLATCWYHRTGKASAGESGRPVPCHSPAKSGVLPAGGTGEGELSRWKPDYEIGDLHMVYGILGMT